jgi:hypothetical protein
MIQGTEAEKEKEKEKKMRRRRRAGHFCRVSFSSLGYTNLEMKTTRKLHYSLWRYSARQREAWKNTAGPTSFSKREINPGGGRNNFSIILDEADADPAAIYV